MCHDEHMCQKSRKSRGSCISGVSVLQKVTLEHLSINNYPSPIITLLFLSNDNEIWHRYETLSVLLNDNKKVLTSLLLRNDDVITCVFADA